MTNLDSILKSRDITLPTKVCLVKAMVFPFWFPLFAKSTYCTLLLLVCFGFAFGCVCECVFLYFSYYLPAFVIAICLGYGFCFLFLVSVSIPYNAITSHLWTLHSTARDQFLSLWSGTADSKTPNHQRTPNPREY